MKISSSFPPSVSKTTATMSFKARFVKNHVLDDMFNYMGTNSETSRVLNRLASECPNDTLEITEYTVGSRRYTQYFDATVKNLETGKYAHFHVFNDDYGDANHLNCFFKEIIDRTKEDEMPHRFWSTDKGNEFNMFLVKK